MSKTKKATRADGRLRTTFTYEGKRYYIYGTTKKELREKELAKLQELQSGKLRRENPTLDEYFEEFIERRKRKVKETTIHTKTLFYRQCADKDIFGKRFGSCLLRDVKPRDIHELQRVLLDSGLTTNTTNQYIRGLRHMFGAAVRDDLLEKNPCLAVEPVIRTEPPARDTIHRALTEDETKVFLEAAKTSHYYNAYRLMLNTGLRVGEVGALVPSDMDLDENVLHVTKTLTFSEGGDVRIGNTTKTGAGHRDIPLTKQIIAIVRDQQDLNAVIYLRKHPRLLFRAQQGDFIHTAHINSDIARICEKTGIERFTCHALRATFATRFMEQRPQDFKVLSEILGHSNTAITLDLYTHVMKDKKAEAMQALDLAF